jgi:ABC-type transporter Mla subunit MlaD
VIAKVGPVVDHADSTIQHVNGVVEDVREPIRVDLAEVQETLQQAKNVLTDMQGVVRANDFNIDDTIENLRVATDNLGQLTEQLKQRPWSLIRIKQPKERKVPE